MKNKFNTGKVLSDRGEGKGIVVNSEPGKDNYLVFSVVVEKITDVGLLQHANEATMRFGRTSKTDLWDAYMSEHSSIRTQKFIVTLQNVPLFVATHLLRHGVGNTPFVGSQRHDNGGEDAGRWTTTDMVLDTNADALISMAKLRLCNRASEETQFIFDAIKKCVGVLDKDLAFFMRPKCVYRNGLCGEGARTCGKIKLVMKQNQDYLEAFK